MASSTTAGTEGPTGAAAKAVLVTLAAAQFVMILDSSVMNVSIATVAKISTHGRRHPDRHHDVHAGDGVADDHRRQDGRDPRPQACLHDRVLIYAPGSTLRASPFVGSFSFSPQGDLQPGIQKSQFPQTTRETLKLELGSDREDRRDQEET